MNKCSFTLEDVREYIEMIKDYVDNYYTYSNLVVFYDGTSYGAELAPKPNDRITQVEIEIGDIKKKQYFNIQSMKYLKTYEGESIFTTMKRMYKKEVGTYEEPIYIHITIFDKAGFIKNEWMDTPKLINI